MQTWSRFGLQVAVVAGGVLVGGTGIADAAECCPQRPTTPLDAVLDAPERLGDPAPATADDRGGVPLGPPATVGGNVVEVGSGESDPAADAATVAGDTVAAPVPDGTMAGNVIAGPLTLPVGVGTDPARPFEDLADTAPAPAFPAVGDALARPVQLPAAASGGARVIGSERATEVTDVFPRITDAPAAGEPAPVADGTVPVQIFDADGALLLVSATAPTTQARPVAEADVLQKIVKGRDLPGSGPTTVPTLDRITHVVEVDPPAAAATPELDPSDPDYFETPTWDGQYDDAPSGSALSTVDMDTLFGAVASQQPAPRTSLSRAPAHQSLSAG